MDESLEKRAQAFMKMTSDVESMDETPTVKIYYIYIIFIIYNIS